MTRGKAIEIANDALHAIDDAGGAIRTLAPIVNALLAAVAVEREACALIADAVADAVSPPSVPFDGGACDAGRKIAAMIRARRAP